MGLKTTLALTLAALSCLIGGAGAEEPAPIPLVIQNHRFTPTEVHVPANAEVTLMVENRDSAAEEFESSVLKIEKIVAGGHRSPVRLHNLAIGHYPFIGEFHADTAQGMIIAE
jgi:hypothetical protein